MRTTRLLPLLTGLALALGACGGSGLEAEIAEDLAEGSFGMISDSEAQCLAGAIVDAMGDDKARQYAAAMAGDVEAAAESEPLTDEEQAAMSQGFMDCDADLMGDL